MAFITLIAGAQSGGEDLYLYGNSDMIAIVPDFPSAWTINYGYEFIYWQSDDGSIYYAGEHIFVFDGTFTAIYRKKDDIDYDDPEEETGIPVQGWWRLNDVLEPKYDENGEIIAISESVSFRVHKSSKNYTGIYCGDPAWLTYQYITSDGVITTEYACDGGWVSDNYQYIDFGSESQRVSEVFHDWLTTNGEQITSIDAPVIEISGEKLKISYIPFATSYDVYLNGVFAYKTLLNETDLFLSAGTYAITVKAKHEEAGFESDFSNSVEYISTYIAVKITTADGVTLATEKKYCPHNVRVALDETFKAEISDDYDAKLEAIDTMLESLHIHAQSLINGGDQS